MRLVNLKASHWLDAANLLSAQAYYRQSNARSLNSNAGLDDGCFNDDGSLAVNASGAFKCANAARMARRSTPSPAPMPWRSATAAGQARINASLVTSDLAPGHGRRLGPVDAFGADPGPRNALVVGAAFDQSNISYRQDTRLARLIHFQTIVIPNQGIRLHRQRPGAVGLQPAGLHRQQRPVVGTLERAGERRPISSVTDTFDVTASFNITASGSYEYTSIDQTGANRQFLNDDGGFAFTDAVTGVTYYNPAYRRRRSRSPIPAPARRPPERQASRSGGRARG